NQQNTSMEAVRLLLAHKMPAVPRLSFAVADVRDIATAHRLAMETPEAAGNRYICAGPSMWMGDIAAVLDTAFGPRGYRTPPRTLPYWLMWANDRFDKTIRLALSYYRVPVLVSADKAKQELGWAPRPASESIVAAGESMIRHGIVPRRGGRRRVTQAAAANTRPRTPPWGRAGGTLVAPPPPEGPSDAPPPPPPRA